MTLLSRKMWVYLFVYCKCGASVVFCCCILLSELYLTKHFKTFSKCFPPKGQKFGDRPNFNPRSFSIGIRIGIDIDIGDTGLIFT